MNSGWLTNLIFFGIIFIAGCYLIFSLDLGWPSRHIACLLEDAPEESLQGQRFDLASPLLSPLACLIEDAPASSLRGQYCELACLLACLWQPGWSYFYQQQLRKPAVNYWQWANLPFSDTEIPELSDLLSLIQPSSNTRLLLESLANSPLPLCSYACLSEFRQWHQIALNQLDSDSLHNLYQVFYGVKPTAISLLLADKPSCEVNLAWLKTSSHWWSVLGVKPWSKSEQVEESYKKLLRAWHPDINSHPWSHAITVRLNQAYGEYQKERQVTGRLLDSWKSIISRGNNH